MSKECTYDKHLSCARCGVIHSERPSDSGFWARQFLTTDDERRAVVKRLDNAEDRVKELEAELAVVEKERDGWVREYDHLGHWSTEHIETLEDEIADWRDQLEAANAEIADYRAAVATWAASYRRVKGDRDKAEAELAEWEAQAKDVEALNYRINELEVDREFYTTQRDQWEAQAKGVQGERNRLLDELADANVDRAELLESLIRVKAERNKAEAELAEWQTRALIAEESASAEADEHENWKAEAEALRTERDEVRKLGHSWKQIAKERADLIDELYDSLEEARGLG